MTIGNALNINSSINQILWMDSATTMAGLATGNNSVLITSAGGVPSVSTTLPLAVQTNITELGTITTGVWNGTILSPVYGGTGINNGASTLTLAGSFSTIGAHTVAFTITGNTAVTFPTAGTLATTAGVINSITGTAGQIDVTVGVNPVISIDAAYVGQASITTLGTIATGVWHGTAIDETHGGTNQTTYTLGDILYSSAANTLHKLAGNTTAAVQYLAQTGTGVVSAAPVWTTISGGDISGAALTKTDDTNVTMTLGGTPATSLLRAASMTLGWTGQLALSRGGSNADLSASVSNGGIVWSNATQMQILAGTATASKMLLSGATATPSWSTSTIPTSAGASAGKVLLSDGTNYVLSTPTFPNASATSGKFIRSDGTNWIASTPTLPTSAGTSGKVLQSDGTNYVESTPTYPSSSGSAGTILRSDGTNNVYSTATYPNTAGTSGNFIKSDGTNFSSAAFKAPTQQIFTSSSGTYTTPTSPGPLYIRVRAVGAGGGGSGSGTGGGGGAGGDGHDTTFGAAITAGKGFGASAAGTGGAGGTATVPSGSGFIGSNGQGGTTLTLNASNFFIGGSGGGTPFGGGGGGGQGGAGGAGAPTNTGAGGGGAGFSNNTGVVGAGGGSAAFVDVILATPAATYAYVVGASGAAGTAGTSGYTGGGGGAGYIEVTEYYQ